MISRSNLLILALVFAASSIFAQTQAPISKYDNRAANVIHGSGTNFVPGMRHVRFVEPFLRVDKFLTKHTTYQERFALFTTVHAIGVAMDVGSTYHGKTLGFREENPLLRKPNGEPDMRKVILTSVVFFGVQQTAKWTLGRKYLFFGRMMNLADGITGPLRVNRGIQNLRNIQGYYDRKGITSFR